LLRVVSDEKHKAGMRFAIGVGLRNCDGPIGGASVSDQRGDNSD
jgi:hypothetical protein